MTTPIATANADVRQRVADLNAAIAGYQSEGLQYVLVTDPAYSLSLQVPTERQQPAHA